MRTNVFVYGTLMRGFCNNVLLARSCFVGTATISGRYRMLDLGFPGLVVTADAPIGKVVGEVWSVDDEVLDALDRLEGVSYGMYRRDTAIASVEGMPLSVEVYLWNRHGGARGIIPSLDYREHTGRLSDPDYHAELGDCERDAQERSLARE